MAETGALARKIPRPKQEAAIQRILSEPTHGAIVGSRTGKGKTLIATEVVLRGGFTRTLIVGIRDTASQWANAFAEQSEGVADVRVINSTKAGSAAFAAFMAGEPGTYFTGAQYLTSKDWERVEVADETKTVHKGVFRKLKLPVDAVIVDEIHLMSNRKSQLRRTLGSIKATWRIGMSATWSGNKIVGAWAPCRWVWPELIDASFIRWRAEWVRTEPVIGRGGKTLTDPRGNALEQVVGEKREGAFVATLPCYIRDEDDGAEPPAAHVIEVDLTPTQGEQYKALERDSLVWLRARHRDNGYEPLLADLPVTQRARLRTAALGEMHFDETGKVSFPLEAQSSKLTALRHVIDNVWPGQSVLILTHSKEFAEVTVERLVRAGYGAVGWFGGISQKKGDEIKARFIAHEPDARYMVATIQKVGTGVDGLQHATSKIAWLSEIDGDELKNLQAIGRIWDRPGMTEEFGSFEHVKIIARDTIDAGILQRNAQVGRAMRASIAGRV